VRLRTAGIAAIALAALALVALLGSTLMKAAGAVTETYVTLGITIDPARIDPEGARDPAALLRADFTGLVRDRLRAEFPSVTGRAERRALSGLLSTGAAFDLARKVAGDPALVGQTITVPLLASDVTDLYLKGEFGEIRPEPVAGRLSVTGGAREIALVSTAPDFAPALARLKQGLGAEAEALRAQAALQDAGVTEFRRRAAAAAATGTARAAAEAEAATRAALRDDLLARAAALDARAADRDAPETLQGTDRSVFVRAGGGGVRLDRIAPDRATGHALLPLEAAVADSADWSLLVSDLPEYARKISDEQIVWIETLREQGRVSAVLNTRFFTSSDSREPELAGIRGALVGSFWTMLVTFALAFPIGVLAAIWLEEFAPKNRLTDFVEVNINNLAAVPSIVFGLLGLAIFLGTFGVPRSSPLAGGMVLALMTLPTIIIASRAAIRAVPPSIRDAALGVGASRLQAMFHHILPLAMPGILTGTIIGMAQALGETAPLIMIGMVAFIVDVPTGITDSATVLPVQVFRWSDFPERAFEARTAAAICVLLAFLVAMNAIAVFLRKRFERRW
jgi:phosphate transport system permease protein